MPPSQAASGPPPVTRWTRCRRPSASAGLQRQSIIAEWGITTAAEMMLVDLAVVHYALALRVHGWIGDSAVRIEHEFFGDDAFTEVVKGQRRIADRFAVAERVQRLSEQLMPTLDRANRMMIRNLKAIKELRQGQVPAIAIGRADQVTVTNRPPRRLRPLKGVAPQPDVTTTAITSGSDARSAVDGVVLVPSGKRRASQRHTLAVNRCIDRHAGLVENGAV